MIRRGLKTAVVEFLSANFLGTLTGCEIRVVPPPGNPVGCTGTWFYSVHDAPVSYPSNIGHYTNNGCFITISVRKNCSPSDRMDGFLDNPDGANDTLDWTAGILDHYRYEIMAYANSLVDMAFRGGVYNGLIEAPRAITASNWEAKGPEWWGEVMPPTTVPTRGFANVIGYAATIYYGEAKQLQYLDGATG